MYPDVAMFGRNNTLYSITSLKFANWIFMFSRNQLCFKLHSTVNFSQQTKELTKLSTAFLTYDPSWVIKPLPTWNIMMHGYFCKAQPESQLKQSLPEFINILNFLVKLQSYIHSQNVCLYVHMYQFKSFIPQNNVL